MAALTLDEVTRISEWTEGDLTGKRRKCWRVQIATTSGGQGGATNTIPASLFGMTVIEEATNAVDSTGRIMLAGPSYSGATLQLYNVEDATDGTRSDPVDFTSTTFRVTIKGY